MARCTDCSKWFTAEGSWQKRCWDCWRADKDKNEYDRGWKDGFKSGFRTAELRKTNQPGLNREFLTQVIALCHPDRHPKRIEEATRITQDLLLIRKQI